LFLQLLFNDGDEGRPPPKLAPDLRYCTLAYIKYRYVVVSNKRWTL